MTDTSTSFDFRSFRVADITGQNLRFMRYEQPLTGAQLTAAGSLSR